jgi:hypothetical protein
VRFRSPDPQSPRSRRRHTEGVYASDFGFAIHNFESSLSGFLRVSVHVLTIAETDDSHPNDGDSPTLLPPTSIPATNSFPESTNSHRFDSLAGHG